MSRSFGGRSLAGPPCLVDVRRSGRLKLVVFGERLSQVEHRRRRTARPRRKASADNSARDLDDALGESEANAQALHALDVERVAAARDGAADRALVRPFLHFAASLSIIPASETCPGQVSFESFRSSCT